MCVPQQSGLCRHKVDFVPDFTDGPFPVAVESETRGFVRRERAPEAADQQGGGVAAVQVVGIDRTHVVGQLGHLGRRETAVGRIVGPLGCQEQIAQLIHLADGLALRFGHEAHAGLGAVVIVLDLHQLTVDDQPGTEEEAVHNAADIGGELLREGRVRI